jgi:hypothetical protein
MILITFVRFSGVVLRETFESTGPNYGISSPALAGASFFQIMRKAGQLSEAPCDPVGGQPADEIETNKA